MVMLAPPVYRHQELGILVGQELRSADPLRFRRISVRGLFCGFVELDGVVSSYYLKSLALELARSVSGVTEVIDMIRVTPGVGERRLVSVV
jgi:osmotically-inducible protein OsmY